MSGVMSGVLRRCAGGCAARPSHRPPRRHALAWLALGTLLATAGVASAQELEVIELRWRLAEEVVPVVQPLVAPGGVLTGTDRMLFVRTSPANLEQIRQAVAALDRRPRELTVSVGQGTVSRSAGSDVRGAARLGSDDVRVGVNVPPGAGTGIAVGARSGSQQANLSNVATVRTLEGSEAWIAIGQVVPLATTQAVPGRRGPVVYQSTEFRAVSTGFYATVRVSGEYVTIEISPRQQRLRSATIGPVVETAGSASVVRGQLGEWIELGAVDESSGGSSGGLLVWGRHTAESRYSAWVRVDEVP
jgi:type II secretory pathway component GspD/PulD (secretin)